METKATEPNILKYFNALKDLKLILDNTSILSMLKFSEKHNMTKNLSTVLQSGGIIKLIKKGRHSEWEWNTINPTREMAIKVLQELAKHNPPRKEQVKKPGPFKNVKIVQCIDYYQFKFFFGLIKIKIIPIFKSHDNEK